MGEKVRPADYCTKAIFGISHRKVYTVKKFTAPRESCFNGQIELEEIKGRVFQSCDFEPEPNVEVRRRGKRRLEYVS